MTYEQRRKKIETYFANISEIDRNKIIVKAEKDFNRAGGKTKDPNINKNRWDYCLWAVIEKLEQDKADAIKQAQEKAERDKKRAAEREIKQAEEIKKAQERNNQIAKAKAAKEREMNAQQSKAYTQGQTTATQGQKTTTQGQRNEVRLQPAISEKTKRQYYDKPVQQVPPKHITGVEDMSAFRFSSNDDFTLMMRKVNYVTGILKNKTIDQKKAICKYYEIALSLEQRSNTAYYYGSKNLKNKMYRFYLGRPGVNNRVA
jgi:hypothetical protein